MKYTPDELRDRLSRFSKLELGHFPTPLDECPRLSAALGGPRILIKREDLTGLAFGGNKVREFEYSCAPAVDEGYDVLLHGAASQSNQSRLTAALAARLEKKAVIVGRRDEHAAPVNGNLLVTHLLGAEVHLAESVEEQQAIIAAFKEKGVKVYDTSSDGFLLRSVSYVDGFLELHEQMQERGIRPSGIYVCSGSHTHVGLAVGSRALGMEVRTVGISPSPHDNAEKDRALAQTANSICGLLDLALEFSAADLESHGEFAGPAYGVATREGVEAISLVARTEGLLLDPVYSGKAFAALLEHVRQGDWGPEDTVIFVHTGGTPALFAYGTELESLCDSGSATNTDNIESE
jgi:1-aminocyclopropane-1-carboxylate deaminase/D-cysteine desulfhydrase-like pyridoxal-dependent ACC family enzyme